MILKENMHSAFSAHLLAEALQELYPGISRIGPAIENGFIMMWIRYTPIKEGDFAAIETKMAELASKKKRLYGMIYRKLML